MEKRIPVTIIVRLAREQDLPVNNGAEVTYTINVSSHGARVVSNHSWQPGEAAKVTSLTDQITISGKVVYCQTLKDNRYCIGLNFRERPVTWSEYRTST